MSAPDENDWMKLKRMGIYLLKNPRLIIRYQKQRMPEFVDGWNDTGFAGCQRTRKSTSGGMIIFGKHSIKSWSTTQDVIALSSGEAGYYGLVKGGCHSIGFRSMLQDMGK